MKRRKFLVQSSLTGIGISVGSIVPANAENQSESFAAENKKSGPLVVGTWNVLESTDVAWKTLQSGGSALDAVEQGCRLEEANEKGLTVGLGGLPDRDGHVTLDACVMNEHGDCGSVVYLENVVHAVSVARKVMEETPHVMLAGRGAEQFAYEMGFPKQDLLTERSRLAWEKWKEKSHYEPIINIENHDTIGMLAIDRKGNLSGACTTSGVSYKMAGRVGDSPIIGAGLFVDNEVGAAVATGLGEEVVKTVGTFLIVELMRQGLSPADACKEAIRRIVTKPKSNYKNFQVGYIAVNKLGEVGYYAIHPGFSVARYQSGTNEILKSDSYSKEKKG